MGRLALLICVVLLSAAMANGTRPAGTVGGGAAPASPVAATTPTTAGVVRTPSPPPPPATVATAETKAPSEQQQSPLDSKRKVPNGPDPIHNRRARWGEAPSKRV